MKSILLDVQGKPASFLERNIAGAPFPEKWLQDLIFENPAVLPVEEIDPGAGEVVPIARELGLPSASGRVYLDMLAVTPRGRLVLVECKLWRNPQARREVIAQILEYAALLRRWSYADLTAYLKAHRGYAGENPIYAKAAACGGCLQEAAFTDAVSRSLRTGDFDLIVAGDGMREDVDAIAGHLRGQGARLALVEFQIWTGAGGERLVVPSIPFRTEVHRQTVLVAPDGAAVEVQSGDADAVEAISNPEAASRRAVNRAFWQRYIDTAVFDHPDQPAPRHGGDNWVRLPLPGEASLTAYRSTGNGYIGFFLSGKGAGEVYALLACEEEDLRSDTGLSGLRFHAFGMPDQRDTIGYEVRLEDFSDEQAQLDWLLDVGNRLINAIRPRLAGLAEN